MTNNFRVSNVSRPGYGMRHRQAEKKVADCLAVWVDYGVSIRDLTLAESIAARNEQARLREPLESAEIPGLMFEPPVNAASAHRNSLRMVWEAGRFIGECTA